MAPSSLQIQLVAWLAHVNPVSAFMNSAWGWPIIESVHFLGLSLLIGSIAIWDLRLIGVARAVPIAAVSRLLPLAALGLGINVVTGAMFLMTEPDQYIYNPSFHFKILSIALAGLNALVFHVSMTRRGGRELPAGAARFIGAASLCLWISVIVCGRFLTFFRPFPCGLEGPGTIAYCIPRADGPTR
jgi:hypothetical protein